jgi:FAD/FMN-containing dehydrogenase/ferredoxin
MTPGLDDPTLDAAVRPSFASGPDEPRPADDLPADLRWFLDDGRPPGEREAPPRTHALAVSLQARLAGLPGVAERHAVTLAQRIVTDATLRAEADRDQNVYLGRAFTRVLTHAVPDLVFLPAAVAEVEEVLRWARDERVPVTVRAAASSALGGSVPADGGLTLDLSHLDHIDVNADDNVCVLGAGARLRTVHRRLAAHGLALPVYPSNLGATFAGWLAGGGLGLNAYGPRRALDIVRAADVILPGGDLVRFHSDGRLDVPAEGPQHGHREVAADAAEAWFRARGLEPFGLADLAGSEGVLGVFVQLVLAVGRRVHVGAFLLRFGAVPDAFAAAAWIEGEAGRTVPRPANLKLVLQTNLRHQRGIWADDDRRPWRRLPSALSAGADMPWLGIVGPEDLGVVVGKDDGRGAAYVYVDFLGLTASHNFAARLADVPGRPVVLGEESVRFAAERFRPQQSKRLGPGLLAAEVVLPAASVSPYLRAAWRLARDAGLELDPEVYFVAGDEALVIAGYLTDHRRASFLPDLVVAPALLDLAIQGFGGRPYVLGRWQAAFAAARFGEDGIARLRRLKDGLDPDGLVNRGVVLGMGLRGAPGAAVAAAYRPGVSFARRAWVAPGVAPLGRAARAVLALLPGPGAGRGVSAFRRRGVPRVESPGPGDAPTARAIHCVNCGECNSVCPVYDAALIRLPQTLTHRAESLHGGGTPAASTARLLELCMRCGNCEEVCQAGIPHLEVYATLDEAAAAGFDYVRQARSLATIRASERYRDGFLAVRPGQYLRRAPAALPGAVRFHVLRAESDAGPAATCLHCGACVPVCPTSATREFADADARRVVTDDLSCIGCGVCVEVCPGNRSNGGQTLRVVETPSPAWLEALEVFEAGAGVLGAPW